MDAVVDGDDLLRFFDRLLRADVTPHAACQRVADELGMPVGYRSREDECFAATPGGAVSALSPPPDALRRVVSSGDTVWVDGDLGGGAEMVLEQLSVVLRVAFAREQVWSQSALAVRTTIGGASADERADALRELGLSVRSPVTIVAVAGPTAGRAFIEDQLREAGVGPIRDAVVGRITVLVISGARDLPLLDVPIGNHVGVSALVPALNAPRAWDQARSALRFTQPSARGGTDHTDVEAVVLTFAQLRHFEGLADAWSQERIEEMDDVQALRALIHHEGKEMLRTLDLVAATDSYR
ncbi:MAG: hypothetical protein ABWY26_01630, partial [Microbacterium sp.]